MCGIIGYTGPKAVAPILLDGLKRLEYRGYDSAGLAVISDERLYEVKAVGKVRNLEALVEEQPELEKRSGCGIAHTRWATHGEPSPANAHPHTDDSGRFAIVHNGIIENYQELRAHLLSKGCHFRSGTDSEVIAHLIAEGYEGDLISATAAALEQVTGTYGLAVVSTLHPGEIVVARKGSPIVIGVGETENLVASDIAALLPYTRQVIYLNDGDIALLTPDRIDLRNIKNVPVEREIAKIDWDAGQAEKGNYPHFMLKEIFEQPETIENAIRGRIDHEMGTAVLNGMNLTPHDLAQVTRIVIAGCGSSMHAGLVGEYFFEDIAGISTSVEQAAEFRYRNPIIEPNTLVIPISQSGETADTIAAVREAKAKGALVTALCNVVGSTIAREAGRGIYLHAGPEISVASTKAFSSQVVVLLLLALLLGRNRRLSRSEGAELAAEIETIPALIRDVLSRAPAIKQIAERYAKFEDFFYIGRGCLYPTALEGALKLKEISYIHAEGYHAAELKHGPISLLDERHPVLALANDIPGKDKTVGNIQECRARKSPVVAVVTKGDDSVRKMTDDVIEIPACSRFVVPLPTAVALQLFAYYIAVARGCEVDQPRNLAKSVTVE
ncbi:glutamine--fructose-6-phosphate transaminase (isomerizing) [uncultured Victivallis sp.]|uniref:glutamine--fructose-6-phosphate transaminase (isomerizing) n=1 Tax=uncultured Victivallis sp. TaxID=354118 RepID=UPI0025E8960F|nr:glutamine--fructose-6-phosphate transaminase (isomerizing) [uncultured Victivallis sp.]